MVYPTLSGIEIKWRASDSGVCILVEGETELEDAWFYNTWFGDRAKEVTFFPQDGWNRVVSAVRSLRNSLGDRRVYGIIDRDFEQPDYDSLPADGILRTRKYTLENYLLSPRCWFELVRPFVQRRSEPIWKTVNDVRAVIEELYRECIPLSAYNWTLHRARALDTAAFTDLADKNKRYANHPEALNGWGDVSARLGEIQNRMGLSDDLVRLYNDRLAELRDFSLAELEEVVTGKAVLTLLKEDFPVDLSSKQAWDDTLSAYVGRCPAPPDDLRALVDLIVEDARL